MIPMLNKYKERHNLQSTDEIKPGLSAIEEALKKLHNPQNSVPIIHVAGTNGKGSTIKMLERILQEHRLSTATFMSPCIEDVHDQIQFNNIPITEQQMDEAFAIAKKAGLSGLLTDFELLTVIAFIAMQQQKPQIALIESGMGGRFDSTNVVQSLVSIIPSIALEHTKFLGNSIEEIAFHKAGIFKKGTAAVIGDLPAAAKRVMQQEATAKQVDLFVFGEDFTLQSGQIWQDEHYTIRQLQPSLKGEHQLHNMALAIKAFLLVAKELHIIPLEKAIQKAVQSTILPGRFEKISEEIWLDGAHNPASAATLRETIEKEFPNEKITMIVGILKDKDVAGVLRELEKVSDDFIFVEVEREKERLMQPQQLLELSRATNKSASTSVLVSALTAAETSKVIVTGSLYLLAQWRRILKNQFQ